MKKLRVILVFGLLLSLTACGDRSTENRPSKETGAQTERSQNEAGNTQADTAEENRDAVTSVAENFKYKKENGEIIITGYDGEAAVLDIPASIHDMPVVAIKDNAFANNEMIEEVILPDSVTVIGVHAFQFCRNLSRVTFGANLEEIGSGAFWQTSIEYVDFPDTVHTIGGYAFDGTDIRALTIPPKVTFIATAAFGGTQIEELVIPSSVTTIQDQAFSGCDCLRTVVIEEGVEVIEEDAFAECNLLESVTFPSTLTSLDQYVVFHSGEGESIVYLYVPAGSVAEAVLTERYQDDKYFKVITK